MKTQGSVTLVSCSPKAALYCAVISVLRPVSVTHIYTVHGAPWINKNKITRLSLCWIERFILWGSSFRLAVSRSEIANRIAFCGSKLEDFDILGSGAIRGVSKAYFDRQHTTDIGKSFKDKLFGCRDWSIVGVVGRLADEKGIRTILDWFRLFLTEGKNCALLLVGLMNSHTSYVAILRQLN